MSDAGAQGGGLSYTATPTAQRLHASGKFVRCVRGPVGSGKTVMAWMEIILKTARCMPPMSDGVIRARWLVMRNTYDELKSTTVSTAVDWFGKVNAIKMHMSPPLEGMITMTTGSGAPMEIQLLFRAMDTPNAVDHLLGLEISGIYANEAAQIPLSAIEAAITRLGRYPKKEPGRSYPPLGVLMDANPSDTGCWWYRKEMECPDGWEFFIQPPALLKVTDPETNAVRYEDNVGQDPGIGPAENVENHNIGFQYWRNMLGLSQEKIDRFVLNRFVSRKAGRPVYPEWSQDFHCAKQPIEFSRNLPVIVGQDFGRTPCAVIGQVGLDGQIRILREVVSDNMGIEQFVTEKLRPVLVNDFDFYRVKTFCFADPAGADPTQVDDVTCIAKMNQLGLETVPAPVASIGTRGYHNSSVTRINNVSSVLNRRIGSAPAFIVDPRCRVLVDGFNGGYHYRRMRLNEEDDPQYTDEPDKGHPVSDVHDAAQYLVCGVLNSGRDFSNPYADAADDAAYEAMLGGGGGMSLF